MKNRKQ